MKKTQATYALISLNIAVFLLLSLTGGSESLENLVRFGALFPPAVKSGEVRRILTASFLHIGVVHIAMNMYFLFVMGPVFESMYGSLNFLIIYLLCGIGGNLLQFAFGYPSAVSAGASSSLYGIFGMGIGMYVFYKNEILKKFAKKFFPIIAINIVISFTNPGIGLLAHLGGMLYGIFLSGLFPVKGLELSKSLKITSVIFLVFFTIRLYLYGTGKIL